MRQFHSIEKLDTGILYSLELASSVSVLLLAFGLIASMANVLTKGAILTDNLIMQRIWAVTQCVGIDAGMSGTIIRAFRFHAGLFRYDCGARYDIFSLREVKRERAIAQSESKPWLVYRHHCGC